MKRATVKNNWKYVILICLVAFVSLGAAVTIKRDDFENHQEVGTVKVSKISTAMVTALMYNQEYHDRYLNRRNLQVYNVVGKDPSEQDFLGSDFSDMTDYAVFPISIVWEQETEERYHVYRVENYAEYALVYHWQFSCLDSHCVGYDQGIQRYRSGGIFYSQLESKSVVAQRK